MSRKSAYSYNLAVLDRDIPALPPEAIEATRARLIQVGGQTAFSDGTLVARQAAAPAIKGLADIYLTR